MKKRTVLLTAFLLAMLVVFSNVTAFAAELIEPTDSFFVADYANVIDSDDEDYIIEKNASLWEETGAQIVIATVEFTGSTPIDDYCYELFNQWEIGDKDKNNGVLLLLATGEEDYYIMTGAGLEKVLSGSTLGNMQDEYLEPDFAAENYSDGVVKIFDALYERVADYYDFSTSQTQSGLYYDQPEHTEKKGGVSASTIIITIILIFVIWMMVNAVLNNSRRACRSPRDTTKLRGRPLKMHDAFHAPSYDECVDFCTMLGIILGSRGFSSRSRSSYRRGSSYRSSGGFSGGGGSSYRSSSSGGSSRRSGFSGGGGSTRGGGAGRGRR